MERKLMLVVNNPLARRPDAITPFTKTLHLVPDSDMEIRGLVRRYSAFLLEHDDSDPLRYLRGRRKFDISEIVGAMQCLSPAAVDRLRADLIVIAKLSLHPTIRKTALVKLVEAEITE